MSHDDGDFGNSLAELRLPTFIFRGRSEPSPARQLPVERGGLPGPSAVLSDTTALSGASQIKRAFDCRLSAYMVRLTNYQRPATLAVNRQIHI